MRRILFDFPGLNQGKLFNPHARDSVLEPFIYLRERLYELGYDLMTADEHSVADCEWVWFWDIPNIPLTALDHVKAAAKRVIRGGKSARDLYGDCKRAGILDKVVVFIGEPPVVVARNWETQYHRLFNLIFTWNDNLVDNKKYFKYHFPETLNFPETPLIPFDEKKFLVNISGNKFSNHPQELYTARRTTIRYFEHAFPSDFDLYGVGWNEPGNNEPSYRSYRGKVEHKWNIYPLYKFGVCYENMRAMGWVTEKIFDCMRANCVPIYWGALNINQYVDEDTYIDRNQFASDAEMALYLQQMSEQDYLRYLDAANRYLSSEKFQLFLSPTFAETIIKTLNL